MTMQGIGQISPKVDSMTPERSTKAGDTSFETFMDRQAVLNSENPKVSNEKTDSNSEISEELSVSRDNKDNSVSTKTNVSKSEKMDATCINPIPEEAMNYEEVAEIVVQVMVMLQDLFGLSEGELQNIMDQLSIEPQDLLLQTEGDSLMPVNSASIQKLVLGIHGIDDTAAFLTSDNLNQELVAVTEQITELLAEQFDVSESKLGELEPSVLSDFAGQLEKFTEKTDMKEPSTIPLENREMSESDVQPVQTTDEPMTVVFETQESAGDKGQTLTDHRQAPQSTQAVSSESQAAAVEVFKENLAEAFEEVRGAEGTTTEKVMNQIVEQVVRHVRIRVMPETTSMQLQLNPASLGRVNLTVAATAGTATATLVVENQMAKEALESQMIHLKETFAEQGLKVDAVEVTVSEFGLKKENEQQEETAGDRRRNRRSRSEDNGHNEEDGVTDNVTAPERRSVDSTVDYTA